jgi:hypothetical protein
MKVRGRCGWAATMKTGPNDMSSVIWALDTSFNLRVFYMLTYIFTILGFIYFLKERGGLGWVTVGDDDENGPKRCQMHCLGPR